LGLSNKEARIVFLGLDNAGKTTLLHMLRDGKFLVHEPTRHPQFEELTIDSITFKAHDLGGHKAARRLWKQYFANVDGVVFIVDSTDQPRLQESAEELQALFEEPALAGVPFAILGNKIDQKGAVSELQLKQALNIESLCTGKDSPKVTEDARPCELFMTSIIKRGGYQPAFKWLSSYLK
jgi:GTP-binding protein SAR1